MADEVQKGMEKVTDRINFAADLYRGQGDHFKNIAIKFQTGPISDENPENGVQVEDVLEIARHRISQLNERLPCKENETAMNSITSALNALNARTEARKAEGVEGTEKPHNKEKESDGDSDEKKQPELL